MTTRSKREDSRFMAKPIRTFYTLALFLVSLSIQGLPSASWGRTEVKDEQSIDAPVTDVPPSKNDEREARKFFRKPASEGGGSTSNVGDHYLAIHVGSFISSDTYQWGQTPHLTSTGRLNLGLTYRLGSLGSLADTA